MDIPEATVDRDHTRSNLFSSITKALVWPFRALWSNGVACVAIGQLFNAVCGILISHLDKISMPFFQSIATRSIFGGVLFWIMNKAAGGKGVSWSRILWIYFVLAAALGALHTCALFLGFELLPAGDAMAFGNLVPAFAVALVWILGLEAMNWMIVAGVLICSVGGVSISHPPILLGGSTNWSSTRFLGLMIELVGSAFGGASCVFLGIIGDEVNPLFFSCCMYFTTATLSVVALLVGYPSSPVWRISWMQGAPLLVFSILSSSASLITVRGFQIANTTLATTMLILGTIFSYILGYFFLGQSITVWVIAGTILISIGIWAVSAGRSRNRLLVVDDNSNSEDEPLLLSD